MRRFTKYSSRNSPLRSIAPIHLNTSWKRWKRFSTDVDHSNVEPHSLISESKFMGNAIAVYTSQQSKIGSMFAKPALQPGLGEFHRTYDLSIRSFFPISRGRNTFSVEET